jgi:potassium-dependent mechanosensitive channel
VISTPLTLTPPGGGATLDFSVELLQQAIDLLGRRISVGGYDFPVTPAELLLGFVLPLFLFVLLGLVVRILLRRFFAGSEVTPETQARVLRGGRRLYRTGFVALLALVVGRLLGAEIFAILGTIFSFLREPIYSSGNTEISIITILLIVPVLYLASWTSKAARVALDSRVLRRLSIDPAQRFSMSNLVRYAVMVIVAVIGFSVIGINLSSLAVLFGVLGIGIGFGLQNVVANFFAGLIIILTRPIKEGDRILVNEYEGTVHQIRLISTVINTITDETIILPNSQIVDSYVYNYSYDNISIIICNPVQVSYSSDLDQVEVVLREVGAKSPYAVPGRDPRVFFRSFDDSGITVSLCTKIRDAREKNFALSWTNLEIWRAFKAAGIEIPFPQRDVHVRSWSPGAAVPSPDAGASAESAPGSGEPTGSESGPGEPAG